MKICYIVGHYLPHIGGVEILFQNYAKGMASEGHEVRVVTSTSGGVHGHVYDEGLDVFYYDWTIAFGHPVVKESDLVSHIEWADIVHTTTFTVAPPTLKVAHRLGKKVIITVHEVLGDKWFWIEKNPVKAFGFKFFEKYVVSRKYDYIHVISEATQRDYLKYIGERENIFKIYNCVESGLGELAAKSTISLQQVFEIDDSFTTFLYFGRPGQSKGTYVLLDAIDKLCRESKEDLTHVKFCFLMSKDPMAQRVKMDKIIKENELTDVVLVRDSVPRCDLFKVVSDADYVVVPSVTEGFGFCAAETCQLGKPLIHSDGGSLPEVAYGKTLSFTNRDADSLAKCIMKVLERGEEAFAMIDEKDFSTERMLGEMKSFYQDIGMRPS